MKKLLALFILLPLFAGAPLTRAEKTNFRETSSYRNVMDFLWSLKKSHPDLKITYLATSTEGRRIPLVIVSKEGISSPEEARLLGKEVVYIEANIHAGEVEGKEASLMMIRDLLLGKYPELLKNQVILFCPIFNPDGNEKFGRNRSEDNGPALAGVRYNGQGLDLNRDFIKQETPEVRGLVKALKKWDPVLFVDMHTTDGSYHRHVVTWQPQMAPWTDPSLYKYSWEIMWPSLRNYMEKEGFHLIPYGNFVDRKNPEKGWGFWATGARYGTNYVGLRNRFSILDENYARAEFKKRVLWAYAFLKSILRFTSEHGREMRKMEREADLRAMEYAGSDFGVEFQPRKIIDFDLFSYKFKVERIPENQRNKYPSWFGGFLVRKTNVLKTYHLTLYSPLSPSKSVKLPSTYVILPVAKHLIPILLRNGIVVEKVLEPVEIEAEKFVIEEIKSSPLPFQGHHLKKVKGHYETAKVKIPAGSYIVSLHQPLSRLASVMLEPLSPDGFLTWGLLDNTLVYEWSRRPWMVPIYRIPADKSIKGVKTVVVSDK